MGNNTPSFRIRRITKYVHRDFVFLKNVFIGVLVLVCFLDCYKGIIVNSQNFFYTVLVMSRVDSISLIEVQRIC